MAATSNYAIINGEDTIVEIIVSDEEYAREYALEKYGDTAWVMDVARYDVQIGDKYIDDEFRRYSDDGTYEVILRNPVGSYEIVQYRIEGIFQLWQNAMKRYCGENISMDYSQTVAEFPAATLFFMGFPTAGGTLEGDEAAVNISAQVDIYAKGNSALSDVYQMDKASHKEMVSMGFRRTFGPEPTMNSSNAIKRLTSRYQRLLAFEDTVN